MVPISFSKSNPGLKRHAMLVDNHTPPTQMKCQSTKFLQCCLQWSPNSGKPCVWIFFFQQDWLNPVLSRALIHYNRNKLTPTSRLAKQISAVEWFNHAVYYDFYAMHSKWSPEHEQACGKNTALMLCIFLSLPLSACSSLNKPLVLKDKFFTVVLS